MATLVPAATHTLSLTTSYQELGALISQLADLADLERFLVSFAGDHTEVVTLSLDDAGTVTETIPAESREPLGPLQRATGYRWIKAAGATDCTVTLYRVIP